jgi:hypothetical protein
VQMVLQIALVGLIQFCLFLTYSSQE